MIVKILLWVIAIISISFFLLFYLIPYMQSKFMLWKVKRTLKKMSKKYNGETKDALLKAANDISDLSKNTKLTDEDN